MKSGIYKIRNRINGKFYIGSSINLDNRKYNHFSTLKCGIHMNPHLQRSWNKYGEKNFEFSTLFYCDKENLILFEQRTFNILYPKYNLCPTAGNRLGIKLTEETKYKMSKALMGNTRCLGYKQTEEHKHKISEANMGHKYTEKSKCKMGENRRGKNTKLKLEYIPLIRELYKRGMTQKCIGNICDVARRTIGDIIHRKTWSWI